MTTQADTAQHRAANPARKTHVPGEPEFWIFVLGDMTIFAVFFALWSYNQALQPEVFAAGHAHVNQALGVTNTLALLTSSLFVALGLDRARQARFHAAKKHFAMAFGLGSLFVVVKFFEYREKILAGADPFASDFDMYYFVFTGVHLMHVLVGLLALRLVMRRCANPRENLADIPFLEGASVYWHLVDVLWVILFLLIYLL